MTSGEIRIWNRAQGSEEVERVYGEEFVRWVYENPNGGRLGDWVLSRKPFSRLYGAYQSSRLSRRKIEPFIRKFRIPMDEYDPGPFDSFNDFFIRRFRTGQRSFAKEPNVMPAFAEGRYLGFEQVKPGTLFPVKGLYLRAEALLEKSEIARQFANGPLLIARLCPVDYHRFHFPDTGTLERNYTIHGKLHSVNPIALERRGDIFCTNEREISILNTENFGKLAYIEVGAMCVGRIVQSYDGDKPFKRGEEKGYFLFGGSTVIVMGEPGRWKPEADILAETARRRETLVKLGEPVARVR